eukprot:3437699-Rhodomonas_salina.4
MTRQQHECHVPLRRNGEIGSSYSLVPEYRTQTEGAYQEITAFQHPNTKLCAEYFSHTEIVVPREMISCLESTRQTEDVQLFILSCSGREYDADFKVEIQYKINYFRSFVLLPISRLILARTA